jgi:hypothetical protein
LCAIGCGIALLALTVGATSTGTADGRSDATGGSASDGAGFAGGRSAGDGNAVGGDEIEFADQLPLCDGDAGGADGVCGRGGGAGEGVCGRGGGVGGAVRAGAGIEGTLEIGGGVAVRGAVIDFARGTPAGAGTTGFFCPGSVGGR